MHKQNLTYSMGPKEIHKRVCEAPRAVLKADVKTLVLNRTVYPKAVLWLCFGFVFSHRLGSGVQEADACTWADASSPGALTNLPSVRRPVCALPPPWVAPLGGRAARWPSPLLRYPEVQRSLRRHCSGAVVTVCYPNTSRWAPWRLILPDELQNRSTSKKAHPRN